LAEYASVALTARLLPIHFDSAEDGFCGKVGCLMPRPSNTSVERTIAVISGSRIWWWTQEFFAAKIDVTFDAGLNAMESMGV